MNASNNISRCLSSVLLLDPKLTECSLSPVWSQETRWEWATNVCDARAPAAAAYGPVHHLAVPQGRRRASGEEEGVELHFDPWPYPSDLRVNFARRLCSFCPHACFSPGHARWVFCLPCNLSWLLRLRLPAFSFSSSFQRTELCVWDDHLRPIQLIQIYFYQEIVSLMTRYSQCKPNESEAIEADKVQLVWGVVIVKSRDFVSRRMHH